jgi:hypothetical protein
MALAQEAPKSGPVLTTSREPVGPRVAGAKGSAGDVALMDGVIIVGIAWLILVLLSFSLRAHNI